MKKRRTITREYLVSLGITDVTRDGRIFMNGVEKKQSIAYAKHNLSGNTKKYKIIVFNSNVKRKVIGKYKRKDGTVVEYPSWNYKVNTLCVNRVVYAWYNNICPKERDVDHIDGDTFNNNIANLQLLTRKENLAKRGRAVNQYTVNWSDAKLERYSMYREEIRKFSDFIDKDKEDIRDIEQRIELYSLKPQKLIGNAKCYQDLYDNRMRELEDSLYELKERYKYHKSRRVYFKRLLKQLKGE